MPDQPAPCAGSLGCFNVTDFRAFFARGPEPDARPRVTGPSGRVRGHYPGGPPDRLPVAPLAPEPADND